MKIVLYSLFTIKGLSPDHRLKAAFARFPLPPSTQPPTRRNRPLQQRNDLIRETRNNGFETLMRW